MTIANTYIVPAAAAAKSLQSCPTLCNPIDGSPPGSPVPGILQARTLEWVAISFSNAGKWKVKVKSLSRVRPSATPWTAAFQATLSMGFSRQEYWSGLSLPYITSIHPPKGRKMLKLRKKRKMELWLLAQCENLEVILYSLGLSFHICLNNNNSHHH